MKLEFKIYRIKEDTFLWKTICSSIKEPKNIFIVVGEDKKNGYMLVHNDEIMTIGNLKVTETACGVKEEDLTIIPNQYAEYDIPKKNLTMAIIEEIQKLNEDEEDKDGTIN